VSKTRDEGTGRIGMDPWNKMCGFNGSFIAMFSTISGAASVAVFCIIKKAPSLAMGEPRETGGAKPRGVPAVIAGGPRVRLALFCKMEPQN
jgi:hypothetical protein